MPRRKLDIPRIKRFVMFLSGIVLGTWSGLTGISAQAAGAPYITFMLGYAAPKASGAAFLFAFWACAAAVIAWSAATGAMPPGLLSLLAAVGATLGALLAGPLWPRGVPRQVTRVGQAMLVIALVYVVSEGVRSRFGGPRWLTVDWLRGPAGWGAVGLAAGLLARVLAVPTGVLLVPLLVFACAVDPAPALIVSLSVAVLAGLAPALGYSVRRERDTLLGPSMSAGGAVGGLIGGFLLARMAHSSDTWPLIGFGVTAMLLCSWLAYRTADS